MAWRTAAASNVLAHTIGMPLQYILREFEGERTDRWP